MSRVPGDPLTDQPTEVQLAGVVDAVTRLWAVPPRGLAELGPWSDDLDFARRFTGAPRPTGRVAARAYDAAQLWWRTEDPALLRRRPATLVLGHRDPNFANYLWDGRQVWIVDFEDAAVSDPATELAIMSEHLSWRGIDADDLCRRFDVDQARLLAARRLWAMFWLWLLRPDGSSVRRNPPGTDDRQAQRLLDLLDR
ncbi:phosphotransferase [Actinoplanes sp. NPDC048796]|uniref:phosphotransferase n=1 Tax=Actinoplanes sp. NPDC048796 TaxID=3155640 RepID=UPI003404E479